MTDADKQRTRVFISYSHRDKRWLNRVQVHLKSLETQHEIDIWDDHKINPGVLWKEEIKKAVETAQVAILLISADFLGSDFINTDEQFSLALKLLAVFASELYQQILSDLTVVPVG